MERFVIMKIDGRYYLMNVTDKDCPLICKVGSFSDCFMTYTHYVEKVVKAPFQQRRTEFSLYIKKF